MEISESPRRCHLAAAALLCFAAAVASMFHAASLHSPNNALSATARGARRELSIALPHGGCHVTYAHLSETPISPTWQASFPGSGARMTFMLVQALTGIRTNDDFDSGELGYENVVTVKTHYPVKNSRGRFPELDTLFDRAIVILRNPINAFPSYFNLLYERMHQLPNHSTRGPNKDWLEYREDLYHGVFVQLKNYEKFVQYWVEKYIDRRNLLIVSYEDLIDAYSGPIAAAKISTFLGETEGVDPIAPESVPCVWDTIVNYKNHMDEVTVAAPTSPLREGGTDSGRGWNLGKKVEVEGVMVQKGRTHKPPSSLRTGPKVRPYSKEQLGGMVDMFQRLLEKYAHDEDLVRIISSYVDVVSKTPIEEGLEEHL